MDSQARNLAESRGPDVRGGEGTSGDCSRLSACKRNFINRVIDMLSRDKIEDNYVIIIALVYVGDSSL